VRDCPTRPPRSSSLSRSPVIFPRPVLLVISVVLFSQGYSYGRPLPRPPAYKVLFPGILWRPVQGRIFFLDLHFVPLDICPRSDCGQKASTNFPDPQSMPFGHFFNSHRFSPLLCPSSQVKSEAFPLDTKPFFLSPRTPRTSISSGPADPAIRFPDKIHTPPPPTHPHPPPPPSRPHLRVDSPSSSPRLFLPAFPPPPTHFVNGLIAPVIASP